MWQISYDVKLLHEIYVSLFDYDSNIILTQPIKSNTSSAIIAAYDSIYTKLSDAGIIPILQYLDNKISKELFFSIKSENLKYQLGAPHNCCLNPAECAIQTFRNYFVAILTGYDIFSQNIYSAN